MPIDRKETLPWAPLGSEGFPFRQPLRIGTAWPCSFHSAAASSEPCPPVQSGHMTRTEEGEEGTGKLHLSRDDPCFPASGGGGAMVTGAQEDSHPVGGGSSASITQPLLGTSAETLLGTRPRMCGLGPWASKEAAGSPGGAMTRPRPCRRARRGGSQPPSPTERHAAWRDVGLMASAGMPALPGSGKQAASPSLHGRLPVSCLSRALHRRRPTRRGPPCVEGAGDGGPQ